MKKRLILFGWLIYKIFQKWWNPIFKQNKPLGLAFIKYMEEWYKNTKIKIMIIQIIPLK